MLYCTKSLDTINLEGGELSMQQKNKKQSKNSIGNMKIAGNIVYLGVFLLLTVFPLFFHNYYYDILNSKYMFYYCTVLVTAAGVLAVWGIPVLCGNTVSYLKSKCKAGLSKINLPDICILVLVLSVTVSTLQSDFKYESFWGNEARYNGLFLWLIYGLAYLVITRLLKFKSNLLDYFLIAGLLVCLFGITDHFQLDILHFKERMRRTQVNDFSSTIGNINLYTAYVGMAVAIAMTLYATAKSKSKIIFYYITVIITCLAMILGRSDNGYLAIGILFVAFPFYLFRTRDGIKRYVVCLATLLSCVLICGFVNKLWPDQVLYLDSVFGMMSRSDKFIYVVIAAWMVVAILYIIDRNKKGTTLGRWPVVLWSVFIGICVLTGVYMLCDANIAGNGAKYGRLAEYLVFSDSWGTHRGFIWKLSIKHFMDFSVIRKLFGFGPDTFGILTHYQDFDTMVEYNNTIFESAHNEYIHYLITIGAVGLMAYMMLLITSCYRMIKKCGKNPYIMAIVFAILAYAAQATVNIAQPIVTPIMFTLLMVGLSACRDEEGDTGV